MNFVLLADWGDFVGVVVVIISILSWVISQFSGEAVKKQQRKAGENRPPKPQPDAEPEITLQTEIDDFVRQARERRERQTDDANRRTKPNRPPQRGKPARRQTAGKRPPVRTGPSVDAPLPPVSEPEIELVEEAPRESIAEHVAQALGGSTFGRAEQRDQFQQTADAEFQGHMDRVFSKDLGTLKTSSAGIFETAAAASVAAGMAAADPNRPSTAAPQTAKKAAHDIALFLANRNNIRDAVILSEILDRPEHRW